MEYLKEENKILREKLGTKRIILNDNQRMRLARLGKRLGRIVCQERLGGLSGPSVTGAQCPFGGGDEQYRNQSYQLRRSSGARQSARQTCTSGLRVVFG